jgi:putative ABC transport system permease protein
MNLLAQMRVLLRLNMRSFHERIKSSLVIVVGLAFVAIALLSILALAEGLRLSLFRSGHDDRVLVMSASVANVWAGSQENRSRVPGTVLTAVGRAPGIGRTRDGRALLDAQIETDVRPWKKTSSEQGMERLRGLGPLGLAMMGEFHLVAGRLPRPGHYELIAGATAAEKFRDMAVGSHVTLMDQDWTVTGHFRSGTQLEGDLVTDAATLKTALGQDDYNLVMASLRDADAFAAFQSVLQRETPGVLVERESDYYAHYWQAVPDTPFVVAYLLGGLLALGAIAGTLHTMTAAVGARAREIALLRAVGFGGWPVALAVIMEATLLAMLGAVLGTGIDWLWLDGYTYNAQGVFHVMVTPRLLLVALGWAVGVALIGAALPAGRAARGSVVEALRDS